MFSRAFWNHWREKRIAESEKTDALDELQAQHLDEIRRKFGHRSRRRRAPYVGCAVKPGNPRGSRP